MNTKLKTTSLAALALLSGLAAHAQDATIKTYIVQLKDEPVASYQGSTASYAATQAAPGSALKYGSPAAQSYAAYLRGKQLSVISSIGAPVISQYDAAFNGFSARMTAAQAAMLSLNAAVAGVYEDEIRHPVTITTPMFLGLATPGGIWQQTVNGSKVNGEGMVLGDVDLGIWPENPSYADHVDGAGAPTFNGGTLAYGPPPASFTGSCVAGEGFDPAKHCNNKLIGAKYYNANLLADGTSLDWTAFNSARDDLGGATGHGGHGDHTASTAAGNSLVPAVVNGLTMGNASGMAPRARIAVYKVCFTYVTDPNSGANQNSCSTADSMAAIDDAVKDGVNAINFSISGSTTTTNDIVEQAFYRASLAGVFVAAAAGNSGPTNTVNHPSPWLTTVAASTHDRLMAGDIVLGNAAKYTGASLNTGALPARTLIRAEDAGIGGGAANLCFSDSTSASAAGQVMLDPAKVAGKVVICTRGTNARVDKSLAVANAGGLGLVFVDNGTGLVAETHSVPTVMVSATDGAAIKSYATAGGAPTASLSAFYTGKQPAPIMAAFSGRGPDMADANIMKPDLTAPGVGVIAAVTPGLDQTQRNAVANGTLVPPNAWASYDGTSMATPHVSGVALLLKQAHPGWSPAAIKSALMTTTYTTLDDGLTGMQNGLLPWSQGAGHINPNAAMDPGLVYDAGKADYVRYQCLTQKSLVAASDCTTYGTLDQTYNLNQPAITVGMVTGSTTVTRTVTNVGSASATYTATASLPHFGVTVTPSTLTLAPGESKSFSVTLANNDSPDGTWQYGALQWTDGTHKVVSPINAKSGKSISSPDQVTGNMPSGSRLVTVKSGFNGKMGAVKAGLKDVTLYPQVTLTPYPYNFTSFATACQNSGGFYVKAYDFVVPAGTLVARWALRQQDVSLPTDDNDLMVLDPDGKPYVSGNDGSNEAVQISAPVAGNWRVCVGAYAGGKAMKHRLSSWIVGPNDKGGNFNVLLPAQVYSGGTATVGLSWSGLTLGERYVGGVQFLDAGGTAAATMAVRVEPNGGLQISDDASAASMKDLGSAR
ncbi:S8 family serine peptidase [Pelomonas sp. KK5]|uniref:S8 family serine peptidase n=1 Tax=Pelomonas sp. KK5 TaxID=1855730 RepID=UPI00097BF41F|nr:S8 family serine peptidase [Pelomonas sp. KK5]